LPEPAKGDCKGGDRYFRFDVAAGECVLFYWNGCESNANIYETIVDCVATCGTPVECESADDCVVWYRDDDPPCELTVDDYAAIPDTEWGKDPPSEVAEPPRCPPPDPGYIPVVHNLVGACVERKCTMIDVRDTAAARCMTDSECRVRSGSRCCEACSSAPIAISDEAALLELQACDPAAPCPACEPQLDGYEAICNEGRCEAIAL
jgi:hypothetical protein